MNRRRENSNYKKKKKTSRPTGYSKTTTLSTKRPNKEEQTYLNQFKKNKIKRTQSREGSQKRHQKSKRKAKSLGEMLEQNELKCVEKYINLVTQNLAQKQWLERTLDQKDEAEVSSPKKTKRIRSMTDKQKVKKSNKGSKKRSTLSSNLKQSSKRNVKKVRGSKRDNKFLKKKNSKRIGDPSKSKKSKKNDDKQEESANYNSNLRYSHLLDKTDIHADSANLITFDLGSKLLVSNPNNIFESKNINLHEKDQIGDILIKENIEKSLMDKPLDFEQVQKGGERLLRIYLVSLFFQYKCN